MTRVDRVVGEGREGGRETVRWIVVVDACE